MLSGAGVLLFVSGRALLGSDGRLSNMFVSALRNRDELRTDFRSLLLTTMSPSKGSA